MKRTERKENANKGFSLVELIVVVAIMAVLIGILAPQYLKYVEKSRAQKDSSAAEEVRHAVEIAIADETIYNDLGIDSTTTSANVVVQDDTAFTYSISGKGTKLLDELKSTFGKDKVDFTSSTYGGKTYTITITYNTTDKGVTVAGVFN